MAAVDPVQTAFAKAQREFERGLDNRTLYNDILAVTSVEQVYDLTDKLQEKQRKEGTLRHLQRAGPFLKRLQSYAAAIDVFAQAKPEILALIWGPIRLLLLWSSETLKSFDAILDVTEKLGILLPQFQYVVELFSDKERVTAALCLFFKDMLDFYLIALKFFQLRKWQLCFEAIWPRKKTEIEVIEQNIEKHASLLRSEITIEHLRKADEARTHALDAFRSIQDAQASQQFQSLKIEVGARFYDRDLDLLRREAFQNNMNWLMKDTSLTQWLDILLPKKILWLQGIPGAGKTFATGFIIEKARETTRTLYVLVSYRHADTTAISIMQSLLFQLASEDPAIRPLLVEFNQRDLQSNTKAVTGLLKTAISIVGPVFVIVDGVDEIDNRERICLLESLLDIDRESNDMRLFFSSRSEDDIGRIIGTQSQVIRVDKMNSASIQSYVNHRTKNFLKKYQFSPEDEAEIRSLISPLATKSKGMFLYSRIILDNISQLNDIKEIRNELRVLPEDLDAAYQRVFDRVNCLSPPVVREKAIKILGWMAISSSPFTLYELRQALAMKPNMENMPKPTGMLNIVELCGPIVELNDDQPQFVHFTVQEYLSTSKIRKFLDQGQATIDLLRVCTSYLSCNDMNSEFLYDDNIQRSILLGRFTLLDFAASNWVELYMSSPIPQDRTRMSINKDILVPFFSKRANYWFKESDVISEPGEPPESHSNSKENTEHDELMKTVGKINRFLNHDKQDEWQLDKAEEWINLDPLTISGLRARVHTLLEGMLCKQPKHKLHCDCDAMRRLQSLYGNRLYKCFFLSCPFFRRGFKTQEDRDYHVKHHSKPWKCSASDCDWSEIGFTSKSQRDRHWVTVHQNKISTPSPSIPLDSLSDPDVFQTLLFELVSVGDVVEIQNILPHGKQSPQEVRWELCKSAARKGSLPMVSLLWPWASEVPDGARGSQSVHATDVVVAAIESEDTELIEWSLRKSYRSKISERQLQSWERFISAVIETNSADVFNAWENSLDELRGGELHWVMFHKRSLIAVKTRPLMESHLLGLWRMLVETKKLTNRDVQNGFNTVSESSLSIPQATVLLELGANVNAPRQPFGKKGQTPLFDALKTSTAEGAKFAYFLLQNGADPKNGYGKRAIHELDGAVFIDRWLEMDWNELVELTRPFREKDWKDM